MGIETATFIADLVSANPGAADLRSQGDDHLRLLKAVLQATFPTASKAFYNPTTSSKNANFTVVAADMNKTFLVDTSGGAINMTLPTLGAGDAGWECYHIKTTQGVNPVFVVPASGTVTAGSLPGIAKARRSVPGSKIRSYWTGTGWYISRAEGLGGPVGSMVDFSGTALPYGFEWPSGQALASASTDYAEFFTIYGSANTIDMRGRVTVPLDNLGGIAAGRVAGATTVGVPGGAASVTLITANLPPYTPSGTNGTISVTSTVSGVLTGTVAFGTFNYGTGGGALLGAITAGTLGSGSITSTGAAPAFVGSAQGGTSTAFSVLQPYTALSKILVVE